MKVRIRRSGGKLRAVSASLLGVGLVAGLMTVAVPNAFASYTAPIKNLTLGVNVRSGPGTDTSVVYTYPAASPATQVTFYCWTYGTSVSGNNIWARVSDGNSESRARGGYISDSLINLGGAYISAYVPSCAEAGPQNPGPVNNLPVGKIDYVSTACDYITVGGQFSDPDRGSRPTRGYLVFNGAAGVPDKFDYIYNNKPAMPYFGGNFPTKKTGQVKIDLYGYDEETGVSRIMDTKTVFRPFCWKR
jgi:uncharacterized protein YraI